MKTNTTSATNRLAGCWRHLMGVLATLAILVPAAMGGHPELPLDLGTAGDFVILSKTGIDTVPISDITGDLGVSPIDSTAITGFSLVPDISGEFSTSAQVDGRIYAPDYGGGTPVKMTTAISDMETAYTQASLRTDPDTTELEFGNISGLTITPGLHKWSTSVLINSDVTLDAQANADAIFIFQISGDLIVASGQSVLLAAGAQAKNIFWQIEGPVGAVVGTTAHIEGVVLTAKAITIQTGASFNGKLLAQTRVDLDQNIGVDSDLIPPEQLILEIISEHGIGDLPVGIYTNDYGTILTNTVSGSETLGGTQYVNTGWSMVGNEPALGTTNTMTMAHTNDAVLTWQWSTNYLLSLSAPNGAITNATAGWKSAGSVHNLYPVPDPGYAFDHWEVNGIGQGSGAPLNVTMDGERNVLAVFAPMGSSLSWNIAWVFDPRQGFYIGTLTISNPLDSSEMLVAPFWLKVQSTEWHWLRFPTGVDGATGMHYQDLSPAIHSLLPGIGNGDLILDPGESVSVGGIELMGRRTPDGLVVALQWETSQVSLLRLKPARSDFDGDGISDYVVYDASGIPGSVQPGQWYFMKSRLGFDGSKSFGYQGTLPVVGDFDGDGLADYGCYDPTGTPSPGSVIPGTWYFMLSTAGFKTASIGFPGRTPVVGDFDGDGIDDYGSYDADGIPGVVKPGSWHLWLSTAGFTTHTFGYPGTVPVVGDFDGDGIDDFGVYDANGIPGSVPAGSWYFMLSTAGFKTDVFGYPGTVPVVGDFDGDGIDDYGCYDAAGIPGAVSPGQWYFKMSTEGFSTLSGLGHYGAVPVIGDFDGDGREDPAIYTAAGLPGVSSPGTWRFHRSALGAFTTQFGYKNTVPVSGTQAQ